MATARHPKANFFVQRQLFAGLTSFAELEQKIAALSVEQSRGDAFEVFAEAYLATQRKHDAETVWPLASVPSEVLRDLQLAMQDYGVDGVLKTSLGKFSAYQVKFRTGRPALTWRELSTFMGLADSPNIHSRILLTNCDDLPSVLNDRQGFFCIRGSDLDRLEPDDFKIIEAWLADSAYQAPKKTPLPHQTEALKKILPAFHEHDRVSAIMACGTGKTLVALWVAERMQAQRILVLLPSLALLRQTLHEWMRETRISSLAYLCVCSDSTVTAGLDSVETKQSDLDFEVRTEPAIVREFLDAEFVGTKIIFSTYQSASVVGAVMKPGETFDLGIFDEAHKTAGREGRNFALALDDKNLPIRKRLFVTATPRHYNPLARNKDGDSQLVFSMDNAETYGPQVYRLPFSEAAKRGIICRYRVIISVISSQQVTNDLLRRGEVLVNNDPIRARQVANQIALADAVAKNGVNKIFTFHSTVKSAASFTSHGNEGVVTHMPDFKTLHVNGAMPTVSRERVMREFRDCKRGIISNARCLTEGVDVPVVDMVAFLAPRRSRVDIVQATGRAMRKADNKTTGYILVPLYLELATNESVEQAVLRSDFSEVWEVLQSLQEQDEVLAEIIRNMRMERGRTKGFDDSRFLEIVDVCGSSISLESLRTAISTACVDALGASWDERFGELLAYKDKFKNCDVPFRHPENRQLGIWVVAQRQAKKFGQLNERQIKLLTDIGFDWQPQNQWDEMFERLVAFKEKYKHCNVPQNYKADSDLGKWVFHQRRRYKTKTLDAGRCQKLEEVGIVWNAKEGKPWETSFQEMVEYQRKHGHCNINPKDYRKLARWLTFQRHLIKNGRLAADKIRQLEEIGALANNQKDNWEAMFSQLLQYKEKRGHCDVPSGWEKNRQLANWVTVQRRTMRYKPERITSDQKQQLDEIGFVWDHHRNKMTWDEMFLLLQEYKRQHGDCDVPHPWPENPKLRWWAQNQRSAKKAGRLTEDKIQRLTDVGFQWEIQRKRSVGAG